MEPLLNLRLIKKLAVDSERIAASITDPEWKRAYQKMAEGCGLMWRMLDRAAINHHKRKQS